MRRSPWMLSASIAAALSPLPTLAAHVNQSDLRRPQGPLFKPDAAWTLPFEGSVARDCSVANLMQVVLDASPPEVAEPLRGRLEDPILMPAALQVAGAAMMRARPEVPARPRTEALSQEQMTILSLIGPAVLILAGSSVALVARAPGGIGRG